MEDGPATMDGSVTKIIEGQWKRFASIEEARRF